MFKLPDSIERDPFQFAKGLVNDEAETATFERIYQSRMYMNSINLSDAMMKLSGVSMESRRHKSTPIVAASAGPRREIFSFHNDEATMANQTHRPPPGQLLDTLIIYSPTSDDSPRIIGRHRILALAWKYLSSRPVYYITRLLVLYLTGKLCIVFYYYYKHDLATAALRPSLIENNTSKPYTSFVQMAETCALAKQISYDSIFQPESKEARFERLGSIRSVMRRIGHTIMLIPGVGSVGSGIIAALPVSFYYLPQVAFRFSSRFKDGVRVDYLAFLFDPLGQRRRVFAEIDTMIINLLQSSLYWISTATIRSNTNPSNLKAADNYQKLGEGELEWRHLVDKRFVGLLIGIRDSRLVQPIVFSAEHHKRSMRHFLNWALFGLIFAAIGTYTAQVLVALLDVIERVKTRLKQIECKRWHPDANVLIWDENGLEKIDSMQDIGSYSNYDGSWSSFTRLVFLVEPKYYLSNPKLLHLSELAVLCFFIAIWATFWASLFILTSWEKIIWLKQVRAQVSACKRSLEKVRAQRYHPASIDNNAAVGSTHLSWRTEDVDEIVRKLTISYLNFELFRRQIPDFCKLNNFLILQVVGLSGLTYSLGDFVARNLETRYQILIIYALALTGSLTNVFLALSSYRLKLAEKLMRDVVEMLAHCSDFQPLSASYMVELWRRQCLTEAECEESFSSTLFLTHVSWKTLLSLNIYLLGLWLILLN